MKWSVQNWKRGINLYSRPLTLSHRVDNVVSLSSIFSSLSPRSNMNPSSLFLFRLSYVLCSIFYALCPMSRVLCSMSYFLCAIFYFLCSVSYGMIVSRFLASSHCLVRFSRPDLHWCWKWSARRHVMVSVGASDHDPSLQQH